MKKFDSKDYYIKHLKSGTFNLTQKDNRKEQETTKEEFQKELKKNFEKDEQKFYSLI